MKMCCLRLVAFAAATVATSATSGTCEGSPDSTCTAALLQVGSQFQYRLAKIHQHNENDTSSANATDTDTSASESTTPAPGHIDTTPAPAHGVVAEENIVIIVKAVTPNETWAGTETGADMSFMVDDEWSNYVELLDRIPNGGSVSRTVQLPGWPKKMSLRALGADAWNIETIIIESRNRSVVVLAKGEGNNTYGPGSIHWLDNDEDADTEIVYIVPEFPEGACVTREDSRVGAMGYVTSPPGTPCVFGVDPRDEGAHCVDENDYGSFGWCYTSKDMGSWGSCDENCPLVGASRILAEKIDQVLKTQQEMLNVAKHDKEEAEGAAAADTNATHANATNTSATKGGKGS